jgi:hypothetical protein
MFKKVLLSITFFIMLFSGKILFADTIPGGDVYGTWYADSAPYYITGNITIPVDSTLTIEPGVVVEFHDYTFLRINGFLEAIGGEADSILFTGTAWMGLDFRDAPDSSHLIYCIVQNVEDLASPLYGGITCYNCNPVISHCRISNNQGHSELWGAGGIMLYNSNANISWCNISENTIENYYRGTGGGIKISGSHPTITGCDIIGNDGDLRGGGIDMFDGSSLIITNCTITGNVCGPEGWIVGGGGIASQGSDMTITECNIKYNVGSGYGGGGICISGGRAVVTRCTIDSNRATVQASHMGPGGGIYADCDSLLVDHCTFVDNSPGDQSMVVGWAIHSEGNTALLLTNSIVQGRNATMDRLIGLFGASVSISYSDFYRYRDAFVGNLPPGLGELTQVNANGDSCDVYYNIFLNPLFVDYSNADYHLLWGSPCIDAGDPGFAYDPDSTITDMGRYFFDQRVPNIALSATALDFGDVTVGLSAGLPLVIYNIGNANLLISDILNGLAVFTHNWNPLDSLILPGDSLGITVTFTPNDTLAFIDTLWIANNDTLCYVTLVGQGLATGIAEGVLNIPKAFALWQPLPNPCNSFARLQFELPKTSVVSLSVYDISGRLVSQLINGLCEAGIHNATLDASRLSAGVYFYRFKAAEYTAIRKVIVTR